MHLCGRIYFKMEQVMHVIWKIDEVNTLINDLFKEFKEEIKFLAYIHKKWVTNDNISK